MKADQIFIADLRKCTDLHFKGIHMDDASFGLISNDSEPFKKDAILIKIDDGRYVDLEALDSALDYIKVRCITALDRFRIGGLIIPTFPFKSEAIFVDENTLRPYSTKKPMPNHIAFKQLKKGINK